MTHVAKAGHCRYCGMKSLKVQYDPIKWYYVHENGYVQCPIDGRRLFIDPYTEDEVVDRVLNKYLNEIQGGREITSSI